MPVASRAGPTDPVGDRATRFAGYRLGRPGGICGGGVGPRRSALRRRWQNPQTLQPAKLNRPIRWPRSTWRLLRCPEPGRCSSGREYRCFGNTSGENLVVNCRVQRSTVATIFDLPEHLPDAWGGFKSAFLHATSLLGRLLDPPPSIVGAKIEFTACKFCACLLGGFRVAAHVGP